MEDSSRNATAAARLVADLADRGQAVSQGILFVVDPWVTLCVTVVIFLCVVIVLRTGSSHGLRDVAAFLSVVLNPDRLRITDVAEGARSDKHDRKSAQQVDPDPAAGQQQPPPGGTGRT